MSLIYEKPKKAPKKQYKGLQQKTPLRARTSLKSNKPMNKRSKSRNVVAEKKVLRFDPPCKVGKFTPCLNDKCYFSGAPKEMCEVHHIWGAGLRRTSERWGMKVYLRPDWHRNELYSTHINEETDLKLKQYAQREFEKLYDHEFFMELFGENYI